MDDILSVEIGSGRSLHIATLSRQTILDAGAQHMGFEGYFLFETMDAEGVRRIEILCKACSLEAALRLADLWQRSLQLN